MQQIIDEIMYVSNELLRQGKSCACPSKIIAAAFVLNDMSYLPDSEKDILNAWDGLDDWQVYVRLIKNEYMDNIDEYQYDLPLEM